MQRAHARTTAHRGLHGRPRAAPRGGSREGDFGVACGERRGATWAGCGYGTGRRGGRGGACGSRRGSCTTSPSRRRVRAAASHGWSCSDAAASASSPRCVTAACRPSRFLKKTTSTGRALESKHTADRSRSGGTSFPACAPQCSQTERFGSARETGRKSPAEDSASSDTCFAGARATAVSRPGAPREEHRPEAGPQRHRGARTSIDVTSPMRVGRPPIGRAADSGRRAPPDACTASLCCAQTTPGGGGSRRRAAGEARIRTGHSTAAAGGCGRGGAGRGGPWARGCVGAPARAGRGRRAPRGSPTQTARCQARTAA